MLRWPFSGASLYPAKAEAAQAVTSTSSATPNGSAKPENAEVKAKLAAARPASLFQTPASELSEKPVDKDVAELPDATDEELAKALEAIVEHSVSPAGNYGTQMLAKDVFEAEWVGRLIPGLEKWAAKYHWGNFVVVRNTGERVFESMPIYARIGMHLLFHGKPQRLLLGSKTVQDLLEEQSIRQGKIYDSPDSVSAIPSFINTYSIHLDELIEPDPLKYKTFNEFFHRALKSGARPVAHEADARVISSCADSRLTVYCDVPLSRKFWVKGKHFTAPSLLGFSRFSKEAFEFRDASIAIFRLAPADYHRFHSPIAGTIDSDVKAIPGEYYTVNPQAVNEDIDVFTANARSVVYIKHKETGKRVAVVAVGALLVGSMVWTGGSEKGKEVKRGEELGYFAYGGSTVIVLFPKGFVGYDDDLVKNSSEPIETLVRVGDQIGKMPQGREGGRKKPKRGRWGLRG